MKYLFVTIQVFGICVCMLSVESTQSFLLIYLFISDTAGFSLTLYTIQIHLFTYTYFYMSFNLLITWVLFGLNSLISKHIKDPH